MWDRLAYRFGDLWERLDSWISEDEKRSNLMRPASKEQVVGANFVLDLVSQQIEKSGYEISRIKPWAMTALMAGLFTCIWAGLWAIGALPLTRLTTWVLMIPMLVALFRIRRSIMSALPITEAWFNGLFMAAAVLGYFVLWDLPNGRVLFGAGAAGTLGLVVAFGGWRLLSNADLRKRCEVVAAMQNQTPKMWYGSAHAGMNAVATAQVALSKGSPRLSVLADADATFQKLTRLSDPMGVKEIDISARLNLLLSEVA